MEASSGIVRSCMESFPTVCTDHDNSMHVLVSVGIVAVTAFAALTAMCAFHERFDSICVDRVQQLWNHRHGTLGIADSIYSKESKDFIRSHPELKPRGCQFA